MTVPPQHHVNAPAVAYPPSGTASSYIGQMSPTPDPDPTHSAGLEIRHRSDIQLREPPIVEVPYTAGKPRNYHARKKKPAASSSRPLKTHTTQQPSAATQGALSSLQLPPPTAATTSTLSAVAGTAGATGTGTSSRPHITIRDSGWRARFILWICCVPIEKTDDQH
ncbi:uncharacterized protein BJ212DRAFT_1299530 [Suillus subaureus]|uniref:Uncharacterized protein n=1 Tax=Suillus subaureus TaxID=48587 RepID=A0A9P7JE06_9AGAM|nr:uncharacterized protein BJ212DRAFT_1299530 [Suillus subaureus]KAG1816786.1 hypothetical protein BJ212DRAFT_1299530 [Suillus subaureus]